MQANEIATPRQIGESGKPAQIASWRHLAGFLLIMAGTLALGFYAQHAGSGGTQSRQLASHGSTIQIYLTVGLMDWLLLYYCWAGVHRSGGTLKTMSGGRWTDWTDVLKDLAIAAPFWAVWEGTARAVHWVLSTGMGQGSAKTVDSLLPKSPVEILLWIGVSITAGICEEIAFRGYLQKQLHALSGNVVVAVLGQGLVFGVGHAYQGWRNVVVISVLGVLFGVLAAWRRNLRTNIVVHAWADTWSGWLKFVVWR